MITDQSTYEALVLCAGLPDRLVKKLERQTDQFAFPVQFRPLAAESEHAQTVHGLTLVLFDANAPFHGSAQYSEEWSRIVHDTPSIAIYRGKRPNLEKFSEMPRFRDLVADSAVDQVTFAINRELNTLVLTQELNQKKDELLKVSVRANHTAPSVDWQSQHVNEPEGSGFPTWVLNRQEFIKYIDEHIYLLNQNNHAALALIEIDFYQTVSEEEEKSFNERCMSVIANIILTRCRPSDVLAYYGKNVFALFTTRYSQRTIPTFAEHLRLSICESLLPGDDQYTKLKCSIGICFWSPHIVNSAELIARAQQACVKASIGDGNQVHIYQLLTSSLEVLDEQSKYKEQVSSALKENRFRLVYQPIVNVSESHEENYAILLRMIDRQGKHLSPDRFLPVAENTGLIEYIDQWVIQQTVDLAKRSSQQRKNRKFFLKISGYSLHSEKIQKCLQYYLKKAKIDGSSLVFQVDYSEFLNHPQRVEKFIENVTKARCKVAFDHFGFGEYSVEQLTRLSVDFIKIDGTFSRGLLKIPAYELTVSKIQEAARAAKIKTVAKSVEDANTLALLWNAGIDFVQGYFIQEPHDKMRYNFVSL